MASERPFVMTLMAFMEREFEGAVVWKPADGFNLGIPDIHAVIPPDGRFIAAEIKQVPKLFAEGAFLEEDRKKKLLRHTFSGPQISMLRRLQKTGCQAYGIVRTHRDIAYRLNPQSIPLDGQVTIEDLMTWGTPILKKDGWKFWLP